MKTPVKKIHSWTAEESEILQKIIHQFGGSPSAAYAKHPDWQAKLTASHSQGAIYAKIHAFKRKAKGPIIGIEATPRAAMEASKPGRLVVVHDGELQRVACPHCGRDFNVIQQPA